MLPPLTTATVGAVDGPAPASAAATVAAALRESATYTPPVVAIISGGNLSPEDLAKYTT